MSKKQEKAFETPEDEIKYLKKQIAGLKGRNKLLVKIASESELEQAALRGKLADVCKDNERMRMALAKYAPKPKKRSWWHFW